MKRHSMAMSLAAGLIPLMVAGCGSDGERSAPSSGDPEADRRATMRVGSDEGRKDGAAARTLFERMGGAATIVALVDDLTERSINDPRVNFERRNVSRNWIGGRVKPWEASPENVERFKQHMVEFLTLAAGGPAEYTGRDMRVVHEGMKITNSEFDAMVGDIKVSLDRLSIGRGETRDLLAIIETTRKQIVEER